MPFFNPNATTGEKVVTLGGLIIFAAIIIGGIGVVAYKSLSHPKADSVNYSCVDFTTQNDAQAYFKGQGGSSTNNVDNLDEDGDGTACESLHHIDAPQTDDTDYNPVNSN